MHLFHFISLTGVMAVDSDDPSVISSAFSFSVNWLYILNDCQLSLLRIRVVYISVSDENDIELIYRMYES